MERDQVNENGAGIFKIPQANYEKFEAALAKLSRKAIKLGGEAFMPVPFSYEMVSVGAGQAIKVLDILLDCTIVQVNGWEFIARIDHANGDLGNIVRALPGQVIPEMYRHTGCVCEHCHVKRFRRDTFLLREVATGRIQQVGSSCLKDFLGGHDPVKLAKLAELLSYANECAHGYTNYVGGDKRYLDLAAYLEYVSFDMRDRGFYVSRAISSERNIQATSDRSLDMMLHVNEYLDVDLKLADEDRTNANQAIEWAQALGEDGSELNDYQHNIKVLAASGFIEYRSTGYAASILSAWKRATQVIVDAPRKTSNYVGEKGQKLNFAATLQQFSSWINDRDALQFRYSFEDKAGNLFTWFTGVDLDFDKGTKVKLTGTVKDFNDYKNVKSTILTRCRVEKV